MYRKIATRRVRFHHIRTNECWTRDHGPAFVLRQRRGRTEAAIVDWGYNAWGGKYPPFDADDAVPTRIAEKLGLPVFSPGIVMEGGAVDFNGAGTVMTTTSCLLNKNRNPTLTKAEIERYLKDYYGQRHVIWLGEGIAGDDTDGHIDDLARFVDARTIVIGIEPDPRDENYKVLQENRRRLDRLRDQDGRPFEIVELPMPRPVLYQKQRLPATYMNFYFVNGAAAGAGLRRRSPRWARAGDPVAPPAEAPRRRRELPRAHLGSRRDSLPDAAAATLRIVMATHYGGCRQPGSMGRLSRESS